MTFLRVLVIFCAFFSIINASLADNGVVEINSVEEIKFALNENTVLVLDADETVSRVDCMSLNWEYGRQYEVEMMAAAVSFYESLGNKFDPSNMDALKAIFGEVQKVLASKPLGYSLAEEAWKPFLESARKAGTQVIIVSSRRFKDEEPDRIKFFESLGFEREHLCYARREKDVALHEWLADKADITQIVFIDNLKKHCDEIMESKLLAKYKRSAFVHNAYMRYFMENHKHILPRQFNAALTDKRRLTDLEALAL